MPKVRDMSELEFRKAIERNGMKMGLFGYVEIDGGKVAVNRMNGGWKRRMQLAYLLREKDKYEGEQAELEREEVRRA